MTRQRPTKDRPERELSHLDQLEAAAQARIKTDGRKSSLPGLKLKPLGNEDPDFHYVWVSDQVESTGHYQNFLNQGYQFVRHSDAVRECAGEPVAFKTKSTTMYYMRISNKDYEEIQNEQRQIINQKEVGLRELQDREYGSANGSQQTIKQEIENKSAFNPLMD